MANEQNSISIEKEPVWVDPSLIWKPGMGVSPGGSVPPAIYPTILDAGKVAINIETTDINPMTGRLICIAVQDLSKPNDDPLIILREDEMQMLWEFFTYINSMDFDTQVGYNNVFDVRYILARAMYYRMPCKPYFDLRILDLMQFMDRSRAEYVYGYTKSYSLSDWSEFFFAYPKPFTDAEMQLFYAEGNIEKVYEFAYTQIKRTTALYYLYSEITRNALSFPEVFTPTGLGTLSITPSNSGETLLTFEGAGALAAGTFKCNKCLAELPLEPGQKLTQCPICKSPVY